MRNGSALHTRQRITNVSTNGTCTAHSSQAHASQRSAHHAARCGRRRHEALLHGLGQVLECSRRVVEEDRVGLAVGADCAPRGTSTCVRLRRGRRGHCAAVAGRRRGRQRGRWRGRARRREGGRGEGALSRIMSKYCVTIMRSMTVLASTSCTSFLKALTDSRSPSMIACRWRAMPWPARNLASASALAWISVRAASASASLTALILTASPSSCDGWGGRDGWDVVGGWMRAWVDGRMGWMDGRIDGWMGGAI